MNEDIEDGIWSFWVMLVGILVGGERLDFLIDVAVCDRLLWCSPSVSLDETMFAFTFCCGDGIVVVIELSLLSILSRSFSWRC